MTQPWRDGHQLSMDDSGENVAVSTNFGRETERLQNNMDAGEHQGDLRLVHIHIPKTAGSSLNVALRKSFPVERQCKATFRPEFEGIDISKYDFFAGHIGFDHAKSLQARTITVLRDPIDRFVSVYWYWRQLVEKENRKEPGPKAAAALSLDEFTERFDEPALIEEFYDRMTWQLHSDFHLPKRREKIAVPRAELLAGAKENLRTIDVVGRQEDMDDLAMQCRKVLGIEVEIGRTNVAAYRTQKQDLSRALRRRITDWVQLDLELYFSHSWHDWLGAARTTTIAPANEPPRAEPARGLARLSESLRTHSCRKAMLLRPVVAMKGILP